MPTRKEYIGRYQFNPKEIVVNEKKVDPNLKGWQPPLAFPEKSADQWYPPLKLPDETDQQSFIRRNNYDELPPPVKELAPAVPDVRNIPALPDEDGNFGTGNPVQLGQKKRDIPPSQAQTRVQPEEQDEIGFYTPAGDRPNYADEDDNRLLREYLLNRASPEFLRKRDERRRVDLETALNEGLIATASKGASMAGTLYGKEAGSIYDPKIVTNEIDREERIRAIDDKDLFSLYNYLERAARAKRNHELMLGRLDLSTAQANAALRAQDQARQAREDEADRRAAFQDESLQLRQEAQDLKKDIATGKIVPPANIRPQTENQKIIEQGRINKIKREEEKAKKEAEVTPSSKMKEGAASATYTQSLKSLAELEQANAAIQRMADEYIELIKKHGTSGTFNGPAKARMKTLRAAMAKQKVKMLDPNSTISQPELEAEIESSFNLSPLGGFGVTEDTAISQLNAEKAEAKTRVLEHKNFMKKLESGSYDAPEQVNAGKLPQQKRKDIKTMSDDEVQAEIEALEKKLGKGK